MSNTSPTGQAGDPDSRGPLGSLDPLHPLGMDPAHVHAIFVATAARPLAEQGAYLIQACGLDEALRWRVERLLGALAEDGGVLETPIAEGAAAALAPHMQRLAGDVLAHASTPATPDRIGPYRVISFVSEGGSSIVYRAERGDLPGRVFALKVLKSSHLPLPLRVRFSHEAEALAMLKHPHIADVYEASAGDGSESVPYLALEFVDGLELTKYADARQLGLEARLSLILQVCDAVQHAHQKGVIHLDLKPANVLVDNAGQVKVVDFGIARLTNADVRAETTQTSPGAIMGTLAYMSPEQVSGDLSAIDTRSDIYAIGVLAHELLAHRMPYDVRDKSWIQVAEAIRRVSPERLGASDPTMRGDIETIVLKALEKEPSKRYQSAAELAADITRYLIDQPISARPPSALYQLRKLARRNKIAVVLVGALVLVLMAAMASLVFAMGQWRAVAWANAQAAQSQRAAQHAMARADLMVDLFQSSDPSVAGVSDITIAEAMRVALSKIDSGAFADDPEAAAALKDTIGSVLQNTGKSAEAEPLLREALEMRRRLFDGDHSDVALSLANLASAKIVLLQFEDAEKLLAESLAMTGRLHPGDHADTARCLESLAMLRFQFGRPIEGDALGLRALEMRRRLATGDDPELARCLDSMAQLKKQLGRIKEAEPLFREALEMRQRLFTGDNQDVASSLNNLASVLQSLSRPTDAEALYQKSLDMYQRIYKGDSARIADVLNSIGSVRVALGRSSEAEAPFRESIEMKWRLFDGDHPSVATGLNNFAMFLLDLGRQVEADPILLEALEMRRRLFTTDHADVAQSLNNVAFSRHMSGNLAEAEPLYQQALDMRRRLFAGDHPDVAQSLNNLASLRRSAGRQAEAEPLYRQALEMRRRMFNGDHVSVALSLNNLAKCQLELGELDAAEINASESSVMYERLFKDGHPRRAVALSTLALVLFRQGRAEEARTTIAQAEQMALRSEPPEGPSAKVVREAMKSIFAQEVNAK